MKLYINILVCVYLVTFCSCNSDGGFYGDSKIPLSTQIEEELSNNTELIYDHDTLLTNDVLNEFYIQNEFCTHLFSSRQAYVKQYADGVTHSSMFCTLRVTFCI